MATEPVPRGYPSPQTEVNTARDVGPGIDQPQGKTPNQAPSEVPYTDYKEVKKGSGIGGKLWGATKWLVREAVMPALEKLIPQGAAELSQALFTGNGFVPYGPTERPVAIPGHGVHGPEESLPIASKQANVLTPMKGGAYGNDAVYSYENSLNIRADQAACRSIGHDDQGMTH